MHFTLTAALALAAATIASAGRHVRVSSHDACKLYQGMSGGGYIYGNDGWGEASHFPSTGPTNAVSSLLNFKFPTGYGGRKCQLRFNTAGDYFKSGGEMIRVFSFVPSNGAKTFDCTKASWNSKGGHRDQEKATFHFRRVGTEVYSFECPSGTGSGEWVNFEVMPAGGDTNMQWHQNKHSGFYIEII